MRQKAKQTRTQWEAQRNKAMSNPIRSAALNVLVSDGPANPAEIARKIGHETPHVTYHVRYLERLGFAEQIKEEIANGNVLHIFRATESHMLYTEEWDDLPEDAKQPRAWEFAQGHINDLLLAARHGLGKDKYFHVTRDHYSLDGEARERCMEIVEKARLECEEEAASAAKRIAEQKAPFFRYASMFGLAEIPPERS